MRNFSYESTRKFCKPNINTVTDCVKKGTKTSKREASQLKRLEILKASQVSPTASTQQVKTLAAIIVWRKVSRLVLFTQEKKNHLASSVVASSTLMALMARGFLC